MSYTVKSNKVYANINDLPQDYAIKNGDRLIIQRNDETYIVDYGDVKVDLEHVTFGETFTEMVNFTTNCTEFMTEIKDSFAEVSDSVNVIKDQQAEIVGRLDAIELILKLIYTCLNDSIEKSEYDNLSTIAKQEFTRIKQNIDSLYSDPDRGAGIEFSFKENNFALMLLT